jgi:hypothetical protein
MSELPHYRILAEKGFYGPDCHLYVEGDEIYFDGVPNEEMEPLNDPARKRLVEYVEFLDEEGRKTAEKLGYRFVGRPRDLDGALMIAKAVERQTQLMPGGPGVPLMGGKTTATIGKLEKEETPQTTRRGRPPKVVQQGA